MICHTLQSYGSGIHRLRPHTGASGQDYPAASDIDMYIVRKNNMYELYAEDRIGITYNIEDIYELVCQYFA